MADVKVTLKRVTDAQGNTDVIHPTTDWEQVENKPSTFTATAHTLNSHTDVDANPTAAGQVLSWDADNNKWIASVSAGGGGDVSKADLQNVYIYGKASGAITKGQAVQFAGAEGGHVLIKSAVPTEINAEPTLIIGIAETDLANNEFGYVIVNGRLNLDTSDYNVGDLLYFASAGVVNGALTTTEPTDPDASIQLAAVSVDGVGNGEFIVRTTILTRQINEIIGLQSALDQKATPSDITTAIDNLVASAPGALDTLDELAAALGDDANFATTVTNSIAGKVSKSGDTMTGNLTISTGALTSALTLKSNSGYNSQVLFNNGETLRSAITSIDADGNLAFYHNGGDKLVIDNSGNVGIGTTTPSTKLEVQGGRLRVDGGSEAGVLEIGNNTKTNFLFTSGKDLYIRTDASDADIILQATGTQGNVGIGTDNPTYKLDVSGVSRINEALIINRGETSYGPSLAFSEGGNINWEIKQDFDGGNGDRLQIAIASGPTVTFEQGGNVGIGTTRPSQKLEVVGDVLISDMLHLRGDNAGEYAGIGFNRNVSNGDIYNANSPAFQFHLQSDNLELQRYNGSGAFQNYPLFINGGTGKVGINTQTASGQFTILGDMHWRNSSGNYMNTDPRWSGDTGRLHIWATTGAGVEYGAAGLALYDGDSYHYIDAIGNEIKIDGNTAWHAGNFNPSSYYLANNPNGYQTAAQVSTAISNLVASAPATLDTLNELAAALGDDPNFATTITNALAGKLGVSAKAADSNLLDGIDSTGFLRISASSSSPLNGNFAIGNASSRNFIQSHSGQPLDINPLGNSVTINNQAVILGNDSRLTNARTPTAHTHDDRYYTESEVNSLLGGKLGTSAKAADSELLDGIDSSRVVFGDGSRGKSKSLQNGNANSSDATNASGFYFGTNVTGMPTNDWWNWMTVAGNSWSGSDGYAYQLANSFWSDDLRIRRLTSGSWSGWNRVYTDAYRPYADTAGSANSVAWGNVSGKPSTFAPSSHTHDDRYYTEGEVNTLLAGKLSTSGKAADSNLLDGLDLHTGRNDNANKVVRTDGSGYIQAGWINTTSGNNSTTAPTRFYASHDGYIRYYDRAYTQMYLGNTYKYSTSRREHTTDSNYWVGSMGWGNQDLNTVFNWGSGFWDSWDSPGNRPSSSSGHWVGLNAMHYTNGSNKYGWQMAMGTGDTNLLYVRGQWGSSPGAWRKLWHDGNLTLASLGYTGATNANYITNNNQLTNGAGYTTNVGDITGVNAGGGISGGGSSGTVTISHADTSSQGSVNNSGATYIQDVTLDTYGHVTGLASAAITPATIGAATSSHTHSNYLPIPASPFYAPAPNDILKWSSANFWYTTRNIGTWEQLRARADATTLTSTGANAATAGSISAGDFLAQGDTLMIEMADANSVSAGFNVPIVIITLGAADSTPTGTSQTTLVNIEFSSTAFPNYINTTKVGFNGNTLYFDDTYYTRYWDTTTASSIILVSGYTLHIGRIWRLIQS